MQRELFGSLALDFLPWMVSLQARSLLVMAFAGITLLFLRRSSAARRHLVLTLAVLSLFVMPLSLLLPSWSLPSFPPPTIVLARPVSLETVSAELAVETTPPTRNGVTLSAVTSPTSQARFPHSPRVVEVLTTNLPSLSRAFPITATLAFSLWLLGTALLLLRAGKGLLRLQHLTSKAESATLVAPQQAEELHALTLSLRLRTSVRLLVGTAEMLGLSPMTWGLRHPIVLLPAESATWQPACLRPVLLHKLAHVQRGDWGTELLARVVCALYWPNPLVWMLARRLQNESESACDDTVLRAGIAPADYAFQLVAVVHSLKAQRDSLLTPSAAVMMAQRYRVEGRVRAILSGDRSRKPVTVRVAALALAGTFLLLLPLANLRNASAQNQEHTTATTPLQVGSITYYGAALPLARRMAQMHPNMTFEEYRTLAATRFVPGRDEFPNGIVAEGLYVSGVQADGSLVAWDRTGNLLARIPKGRESRLKAGELRFQIDRLKLPGTPEWIDKTTFDRLTATRVIESEFGIVGEPAGYFGKPGATEYANGYYNFIASSTGKPGRAATVDLYLTTSYGPWQELVPSNFLTLSPLVTRRGGVAAEVIASIPARYLARDANGKPLWCLRLEPVDAQGNAVGKPRVVQYNETPPGSPVSRLRFRFLTSELPFAKVTSVRLWARSVQTLYFRNVPTRPLRVPGGPTASN